MHSAGGTMVHLLSFSELSNVIGATTNFTSSANFGRVRFSFPLFSPMEDSRSSIFALRIE